MNPLIFVLFGAIGACVLGMCLGALLGVVRNRRDFADEVNQTIEEFTKE